MRNEKLSLNAVGKVLRRVLMEEESK